MKKRGRIVESSIDIINVDVRKAMEAGAWMLAFAGVCIAMDILAKDHFFNEIFTKVLPQKKDEEFRHWVEKRLFPEWDKYRKRPGNLKQIYLWALKRWGVADEAMREKIYTFRNGMIHSFEPNPFSISHDKSSTGKIVNRCGEKTILYLPDFLEFEKRSYEKVKKAGIQFTTFRLLETTND